MKNIKNRQVLHITTLCMLTAIMLLGTFIFYKNKTDPAVSAETATTFTMAIEAGKPNPIEEHPFKKDTAGYDVPSNGNSQTYIRYSMTPEPPSYGDPGSPTIALKTSGGCSFAHDGFDGFQLKTKNETDYWDGYPGTWFVALDDDVYTGNRSCTVTATTNSSNAQFNNLKASLTIKVIDDEKAPPPPPPPASSPTPSSSSTAQPAPTAAQPNKPQPPTEQFTVNGLKPESTEKINVEQGKPITLSGKTVPEGRVTLYIYSEPKKETTTADKNGDWSYTVTGLEPGEHRVEAEVHDPATKQTSKRSQLLAFSVVEAEEEEPVETAITDADLTSDDNALPYWLFGVILIGVALIGGAVWYVLRRKKGRLSQAPGNPDTSKYVEEPEDQNRD